MSPTCKYLVVFALLAGVSLLCPNDAAAQGGAGSYQAFYISGSNVIHLYTSSGSWHWNNATTLSGAAPGAPPALSGYNFPGGERVYYEIGGDVWMMAWTSSGWSSQNLTTAVGFPSRCGCGTAAAGAVDSFYYNSQHHVFFIAANEHIYHLTSNGAAWSATDLTAATGNSVFALINGPLKDAAYGTCCGFSPYASEAVFFIDIRSHYVYMLSTTDGTNWTLTNVGGTVLAYPALENLSGYTDSYGTYMFVLSDSDIFELYRPSGSTTWAQTDLTTLTGGAPAKLPSSIAAFINEEGDSYVAYVGTDGNAHAMSTYRFGSWGNTNGGGNFSTQTGTDLAAFTAGNYPGIANVVFFTGPSSHVNALYWPKNSTPWQEYDMNSLTGAPAPNGETALLSFFYYYP